MLLQMLSGSSSCPSDSRPHELAPRALVFVAVLAFLAPLQTVEAQQEGLECSAERSQPLVTTDPALCADLESVVREPSALPLDEYQAKLGDFLRNFCHRNAEAGWKRDKYVRDTGPYIASLENGEWVGRYYGTHAPVVIWYSSEMIEWLRTNRPVDGEAPAEPALIPDGTMMIKEMFPHPAGECSSVDPLKLLPTSGAAVMVRDLEASHDGWFWGWFGWSGWDPDWPAGPENRLPYMGFGQYCMNCHASAEDNLTFASLKNIEGEPGDPLVFLSQDFFDARTVPSHHRLVALPTDDAPRLGQPRFGYNPAFTAEVPAEIKAPTWETVPMMPSESYDNKWVEAGGPTARDEFVTSDQCLGCHNAGSTGLQYNMTEIDRADPTLLRNLSPYATWRTSPMGLGGRDPIFYAQLASETETFHPEASAKVQDICLGCHGVLGQRQYHVDQQAVDESGYRGDQGGQDDCSPFLREYANAVPWPSDNPDVHLAPYGALARDGISCTSCHRMLVGKGPEDPAISRPENACVKERQDFLNPKNTGFAKTFTGSFLVGAPDRLIGPFEDPKQKPMDHAMGILPEFDKSIQSSEVCGSCHTVHLPVMRDGDVLSYTYEQTTYPEWAFSAYRTGETADGTELAGGAGTLAESCQGCHMASQNAAGEPFRSKIASIQEHTNFPEAEHNLLPADIDLEIREGFARHTLVGLNIFFIKMAQQFPDVIGIRTQDPMMVSAGVDPLLLTEQKMLDQASAETAELSVSEISLEGGKLRTRVHVDSKVGHKFPSGVGFRRAFIEFQVRDAAGGVLWASGRSSEAGLLVDEDDEPLPGELWWKGDCSGLRHPDQLVYQPHHQKITRQDQAQIYQELVTAPADVRDPRCGSNPVPGGHLTTSFLSICGHVKDNRILPDGFLDYATRSKISHELGAGDDLARDTEAHGVDGDPDYLTGGGDSLWYEVELAELRGRPESVEATLFYQAIPPYYLQDRFCTGTGDDTARLYFLAGHLNLEGTEGAGWKFKLVSSGEVAVPIPKSDSPTTAP